MMPADEPSVTSELEALRKLAATISEFRKEYMDKARQDFERELAQVVEDGFDPARGRGRGPRWADGG